MTRLIKLGLLLLLIITLSACATSYSGYTSGFGTPQTVKRYAHAGNLWEQMADHFNLPEETTSNPLVREEVDWYTSHPGYLQAVAIKAKPYLYYIYQQVKRRNLPAEIALMPMVESAYNPFAINMGSGAAGLWQMMTGTALGFGLHVNWWYDGRRDVVASTNAALDYLAYLGNFFNDNWLLAIAAYDTGEGNVQQAVEENAREGKATDFWALRLPRETQIYVPKILALATIIKHPDRYPTITLPYVANAPYLAQVNVGSQIDLANAAKMAGISLQKLSALNPGYNRWATSPTGPFKLLLPIDDAARFEANLRKLPNSKRVTWYRVTIKPGDSLDSIAARYHTSVAIIKQVNKLPNNIIHINQKLLIPNQHSKVTDIVIDHEKHYFHALHNIPEPNVIHYRVKPGETLWSLAKKFNVSTRDLKFWNGIKSNTIKPGTTIAIWPPKPKPVYLYYTSWPYRVRPGDSLLAISKRYHANVDLLKKYNHLTNNTIRVKQLLRIPVAHYTTHKHRPATRTYHRPTHITNQHHHTTTGNHYTVKSGDDLYSIARHYGISETALKRENRLTSNMLHVGQVLTIPTKSASRTHVNREQHYTVRKGDTIYAIAHRFKIEPKQLMEWNNIRNPEDLHIGQTLTIR